jgi:hypothetical protein
MSSSRTRSALRLLACLALCAAAPAAVAAPPVVEAFVSAVRDGKSQQLLSVWPRKGSVKLFGEKFDFEKAASRCKFEDGVYVLTRWPKEGDKSVAPEVSETQQGRATLYTVKPAGLPGPVCFLRAPKPSAEPLLVECREK